MHIISDEDIYTRKHFSGRHNTRGGIPMFFKKPRVVTKTYKNSKERDKDVPKMANKGYIVQSITPEGGKFKSGKAAALGVGGAVIMGPLGIAAGALAGHKDTKWHVVFVLANK
jgi:hypothetical protein